MGTGGGGEGVIVGETERHWCSSYEISQIKICTCELLEVLSFMLVYVNRNRISVLLGTGKRIIRDWEREGRGGGGSGTYE